MRTVMMWSFGLLLLGCVSALDETVYLRDVTGGNGRERHLEAGLPSYLEFQFKRNGRNEPVVLRLQENTRLNENAPMFRTVSENGINRLEPINEGRLKNVKYYHDKRTGGAFMVKCSVAKRGPCKRQLEGNFYIDGLSHDLMPVTDRKTTRQYLQATPHVLSLTRSNIKSVVNDFKNIPLESLEQSKRSKRGYQGTEDTETQEGTGKDGIKKQTLLKSWYERDLVSSRQQQGTTYAVEVLLVLDQSIWARYFDIAKATNGMTRDQVTRQLIRERFSYYMHGISLRYEEIDDPKLNIYVTLSGFLIYKTGNLGPLQRASFVTWQNNKGYVEGNDYLDELGPYMKTLTDLPHNDHVMLFTHYDMYSDKIKNNGLAGIAWVSGVCQGVYRMSVSEETSYFDTVSVGTHELGHNLGSSHDASGSSKSCKAEDEYLMTPYLTRFNKNKSYSENPWKFSTCSIAAFKSYIEYLSKRNKNCLLDHGDYANKNQYDNFVATLPGERHSVNEQCRLIEGASSSICGPIGATSEDICRLMSCKKPSNNQCSIYIAAARGTPCGALSANKWCINGLCVKKTNSRPTTTTESPSTESTTYWPWGSSESTTYWWWGSSESTTYWPWGSSESTTYWPWGSSESTTYWWWGNSESTTDWWWGNSESTTYWPWGSSESTTYWPWGSSESTTYWWWGNSESTTYWSWGSSESTTFWSWSSSESTTLEAGSGECIDEGYMGISCSSILYWAYNDDLEAFCGLFDEECCNSCSSLADANDDGDDGSGSGECINTGYYGLSCDILSMWYNHRQLCQYYDQYCCAMCQE